VFYGAGGNMWQIIRMFNLLDFDFPIWGIRHNQCSSVLGKLVSAPDYKSAVNDDDNIMVISILDDGIVNSISAKFSSLGYRVVRSSDFRQIGSSDFLESRSSNPIFPDF
jgi:hypothetical protein